MQTQETPKILPALDKVSTEDLRAWRDTLSTPLFAFFSMFLEKSKNDAMRTVMSAEAFERVEKTGRGLQFYQGKCATIKEVQAFFKDIEVELTNRQRRAESQHNADNERKRRQRQPQ